MVEAIRHKECDGCYSIKASITSGPMYCTGIFNIDGICPCSNCLIKPMCKSECKEYTTFKKMIIDFRVKDYEDDKIVKELESIGNEFKKSSV